MKLYQLAVVACLALTAWPMLAVARDRPVRISSPPPEQITTEQLDTFIRGRIGQSRHILNVRAEGAGNIAGAAFFCRRTEDGAASFDYTRIPFRPSSRQTLDEGLSGYSKTIQGSISAGGSLSVLTVSASDEAITRINVTPVGQYRAEPMLSEGDKALLAQSLRGIAHPDGWNVCYVHTATEWLINHEAFTKVGSNVAISGLAFLTAEGSYARTTEEADPVYFYTGDFTPLDYRVLMANYNPAELPPATPVDVSLVGAEAEALLSASTVNIEVSAEEATAGAIAFDTARLVQGNLLARVR